ncbi:hypothetical protein IV73_GL000965 [Weissella kandleri]|uniref:Uncharacterized protein n=1 Tax=Weissella kandleri TaxID=1616 RepID=A0A0R2JCY7_9LACO|nr:hypothetical protein [Weissella kandleri]KRN75203.1 hypothetical protein IV73_GL000965 [Weissella kandleri]
MNFDDIKDKAQDALHDVNVDDLKDKAEGFIEDNKDNIDGAVDKIKGMFNKD